MIQTLRRKGFSVSGFRVAGFDKSNPAIKMNQTLTGKENGQP
jgi:hypothetical protein